MTTRRLLAALMLTAAFGCTITAMADEPKKPADKPAEKADKPATSQPAVFELQKIDHGLTIDGDLSKPEWQAAQKHLGDYSNAKAGALSATPRMSMRFLWDDHYLYIGYEFFTPDIQAAAQNRKQGPEDNLRETSANWLKDRKIDIAEFFVTFSDPHFFWELHHNGLNQFNDIWITVPEPTWKLNQQAMVPYGIRFAANEYLDDEGEYKFAMATKLLPKADGKPSTPNDPSDVDTGYSAELRIPFWGLGANRSRMTKIKVPATKKEEQDTYLPGPWKMTGEEIQILAVYQAAALADNDRYYHSSPTKPPGGWFHQMWPHWPKFKFVDNTKKPTK